MAWRFQELHIYGFVGDVRPDRNKPKLKLPSVIHHKSKTVLHPPFEIEDGVITNSHCQMSKADFDRLVEKGDATSVRHDHPAHVDSCIFFPPGDLPFEVTSLEMARLRLIEFAEGHARTGDKHVIEGNPRNAIQHYALAADAVHSAKYYARLLGVLADSTKKKIVKKLYEQVANGTPLEDWEKKIKRDHMVLMIRDRQTESTARNTTPTADLISQAELTDQLGMAFDRAQDRVPRTNHLARSIGQKSTTLTRAGDRRRAIANRSGQ